MTENRDVSAAFRANPRTRHPAVLVREDGSEDAVTITEFTDCGFRLIVVSRPRPGERIMLRAHGGGDLTGKIRWSQGVEAGGSF